MKKRIVVLFPLTENIHLTKDVGMIPYILQKYHGYEATIATYKIGEYPYLEREVKGLKLDFLKKVFNNQILDGIWYILQNYKSIDVLMTYNFHGIYRIWLFLFKLLKGVKGRTYLKLDANYEFKSFSFKNSKSPWLNRLIFSKIDLVSVETKNMEEHIRNIGDFEAKYMPNGYYDYGNRKVFLEGDKEDLIITVGRIGDPNKANEVLCEAFASFAAQNKTWKLKLIGPVINGFEKYLDSFLKRYPELYGRIETTGAIADKAKLNEYYKRAKLFALTSKSESFGLVLLEALQHGCYIVTTDITSAEDITGKEQFGKIFPTHEPQLQIADFLEYYNEELQNHIDIESIQNFVYSNFYWPTICEKLDLHLFPKSQNDEAN